MWSDNMCNSSLVYNMSRACVQGIDKCDGGDEYGDMCDEIKSGKCYPYSNGFSIFVSCWCVIIAVVGTFTNLLTICAIPRAVKLKRFGIANISGGTTIFIINLAVADLLYCAINLPLYTTTYLNHVWPFGEPSCVIFAAFHDTNAYAEWMAMAAVAFSRYMGLVWKDWAETYLTGLRGVLAAVFTWIWAYTMMLMTYFGESGAGGYDCTSGVCQVAQQAPTENFCFFKLSMLLASLIPGIIILTCYTLLLKNIKKTYKHLSKQPPICKKHRQEMNLTWAMIGVALCFLICVGPFSIWNIVHTDYMNPNIGLGLYCIYWVQYSLNFFVYAFKKYSVQKSLQGLSQPSWKGNKELF